MVNVRPLRDPEAGQCESILRALPQWFGIEDSILQYRHDIESMDTVVAEANGELIGFLTWRRFGARAAEVQVVGVRPEWHRRGIGRALLHDLERRLELELVEYLQVKTLGPTRPDPAYARTHRFYEAMGFVPLEENRLWGDANPCLIMVKHLSCGPRGGGSANA